MAKPVRLKNLPQMKPRRQHCRNAVIGIAVYVDYAITIAATPAAPYGECTHAVGVHVAEGHVRVGLLHC
jgi:hypothetical protein